MAQNHKIKDLDAGQGKGYLDRRGVLAEDDRETRFAAEAARLRALIAAGAIPEECGPGFGPGIAPAPARGGFVLVKNHAVLPQGDDGYQVIHSGYGGRSAIRQTDVFDGMIAAAARRGVPCTLTPGQIATGRRYADLVELLATDGTKLSQLEASRGGSEGRDWMDRRLELSAELERMRRRLGSRPAMILRRIRPSQRKRELAPGEVAPNIFTRRDMIDAVCVRDMTIKQLLARFHWTDSGRNCKAAGQALGEALDAMIGVRG